MTPQVDSACAASLGFVLNCSTYGVIKLAGPMTQKVLGTAKTVGMVSISCLFLGDSVTLQQWMGYVTSLLGFFWYRWLSRVAASSPKPKSQ